MVKFKEKRRTTKKGGEVLSKKRKKGKVVKFIKEKRKRTDILKKKPERTNSLEIFKVVKLKRYQTSKKNRWDACTKKSLYQKEPNSSSRM